MAYVKWYFYDSSVATPETYTFDVNPSEGGSPTKQKNLIYKNTAGPNGNVLVFEGRDNVKEFTVSGVLLTEAQYTALDTWYEKRHQVEINDDLGRNFSIYITGLRFTRKRSFAYPWKHEWEMNYIILDW